MKKKLIIKFWKPERALAMQVVEQEGLPRQKTAGVVRITTGVDTAGETLYLRGEYISSDFDVVSNQFDDNEERDKWLNKITNAITDELFTNGQGGLKVGEYCEVRNYKGYAWEKLKLLTILPNPQTYKYICEARDDDTVFYSYAEARPITKRVEPKIETNGEIITYTWEEE